MRSKRSTNSSDWLRPVAACLVVGFVGGLVVGFVGGCGGTGPPAAAYNQVLTPQEADQKLLLSSGDEAEAGRAMESTVGGRAAVDPPARAPDGVRWEDVPIAVGRACDVVGVEMVVVQTIEQPDSYKFQLRTIEDWPGELVIERVDGPQVYSIGGCSVGRFPDEPEKVARCAKLVKEFEMKLKVLGRQKWFNDED